MVESRIKTRMGVMAPFKPDHEVTRFQKELDAIDKKMLQAIQKDASKPEQLSWLPTRSARSSFFSPIADQNIKEDRLITRKFGKSKRYGLCTVKGPALNIVDEGIFLAILYFVKEQNTNIIKINYKAMCDLLGLTYQTRNRQRIKKGIEKLFGTYVKWEFKGIPDRLRHILMDVSIDKEFSIIKVNRPFYDYYLRDEITLINLQFRRSLQGDVVKALYRFLVSHRGLQKYHVRTLVDVLNLNPEQDLKYHRRSLKRSFGQLRNKGFLSFQYDQKADQQSGMFYDIKLTKGLLAITKTG